ncbi:hypothetical protein HZS_6123 [Henneguya salminicola]|nr:hypothetical protein HZS_6123 [Henneguya salminicola]
MKNLSDGNIKFTRTGKVTLMAKCTKHSSGRLTCSCLFCDTTAILNACKQEFSGSILIGCYFHLKLASYRKLKKLYPNEKKNLIC